MEKSDFVKMLKIAESTDLDDLFVQVTGKSAYDIEEEDPEKYALYFLRDEAKFSLIKYIIERDKTWRDIFESQNPVNFISWVGVNEVLTSTTINQLEKMFDWYNWLNPCGFLWEDVLSAETQDEY